VLIGKERHDIGRPHDWGYPVRGIVKDGKLYLHNFEIDRWPAGNPETGYLNCDASPTKTAILEARRNGTDTKYWQWSFGKRPQEELFDIAEDPLCMTNLAASPAHAKTMESLRRQLFDELKAQQDPRMFGQGEVFDKYEYANPGTRNFYERYMRGEAMKAGWVSPTDFEKSPLP
jgi:N-sulfoglucosamine sulfohydrolase